MTRHPMTPQEFDAACRKFESLRPGTLQLSSGVRSVERNDEVGGHPQSKHLYAMARDYHFHVHEAMSVKHRLEVEWDMAENGFWFVSYDWGVHLQGLPPGPIPVWWWEKYAQDFGPLLQHLKPEGAA